MNAVIRKGQMAGCQNKFQAQLSFKKPTVTGQLIHTLKKKKKGNTTLETPKRPQDKMLSIPNYYKRNGNENKQKKSNPI